MVRASLAASLGVENPVQLTVTDGDYGHTEPPFTKKRLKALGFSAPVVPVSASGPASGRTP